MVEYIFRTKQAGIIKYDNSHRTLTKLPTKSSLAKTADEWLRENLLWPVLLARTDHSNIAKRTILNM